jgi:hypothetical protein
VKVAVNSTTTTKTMWSVAVRIKHILRAFEKRAEEGILTQGWKTLHEEVKVKMSYASFN